MFKIIENFCSETNIHGFAYIVQPKRLKFEKVFWSFSIFASFCITGVWIYKFIIESQLNPIVQYTDQNIISVNDIYFPSVSFCPGVLIKTLPVNPPDYLELKRMLEMDEIGLENVTQYELKMMQVASIVANDRFMSTKFPNLSIPTDDFVERLNDFGRFLGDPLYIQHRFHYYFYGNWSNKYPANLTRTLSSFGNCYTFNFPNSTQMFHIDRMSKDFNYNNVTMLGSYYGNAAEYDLLLAYPVNATGPGKGLFLGFTETFSGGRQRKYGEAGLLQNYLDFAIPKTKFDGLKMMFHDPYEAISKYTVDIHGRDRSYFKISITPKLSTVDETMLEFDVNERKCYMKGERTLEFFKIYNKINCEHECLMELTLAKCDCVQFYMVRMESTKICGIIDENCFRSVENEFESKKSHCKCYDPCEIVRYDIKKVYDWTRKTFYTRMGQNVHSIETNIEFSLKEILALTKRKSQTTVDIFSFIGGFLGLFAGFSFLSAGEIIYHFLISPLKNLRKKTTTKVQPIENINYHEKIHKKLVLYVDDFFQNSSIHGLNHIGNAEKSILERIIWFVIFCTSMVFVFLMVRDAYDILNSSKIVMSLEGMPTKVDDLRKQTLDKI